MVAILKLKMAAIMEFLSLASTLKMLRIALPSIVPNFMLLSKSAQLFHISAQPVHVIWHYTIHLNTVVSTLYLHHIQLHIGILEVSLNVNMNACI